ncbi:MAG: hypothetical protein LBU39_00845 [Desulfobulbaceae bacterium]|nr:hypothetical protein [Desulfobulbaceae bacterium]
MSEIKSSTKAIGISAILVLLFCVLFHFYGYNNTWKLWNIPVMSPHFMDMRAILHGAESVAQGFDPMIQNPG